MSSSIIGCMTPVDQKTACGFIAQRGFWTHRFNESYNVNLVAAFENDAVVGAFAFNMHSDYTTADDGIFVAKARRYDHSKPAAERPRLGTHLVATVFELLHFNGYKNMFIRFDAGPESSSWRFFTRLFFSPDGSRWKVDGSWYNNAFKTIEMIVLLSPPTDCPYQNILSGYSSYLANRTEGIEAVSQKVSSPAMAGGQNSPARLKGTGFLERLTGKIIAGSVLVVVSPAMLIITGMLMVEKILGQGSVFYKQKRLFGYDERGERRFGNIWKFRSMVMDADPTKTLEVRKGDKRVTLLGQLMRPTGLDELPQLIQVLKGDLALTGFRPLTEAWLEAYPGWERIMRVRRIQAGVIPIRYGLPWVEFMYFNYYPTGEARYVHAEMCAARQQPPPGQLDIVSRLLVFILLKPILMIRYRGITTAQIAQMERKRLSNERRSLRVLIESLVDSAPILAVANGRQIDLENLLSFYEDELEMHRFSEEPDLAMITAGEAILVKREALLTLLKNTPGQGLEDFEQLEEAFEAQGYTINDYSAHMRFVGWQMVMATIIVVGILSLLIVPTLIILSPLFAVRYLGKLGLALRRLIWKFFGSRRYDVKKGSVAGKKVADARILDDVRDVLNKVDQQEQEKKDRRSRLNVFLLPALIVSFLSLLGPEGTVALLIIPGLPFVIFRNYNSKTETVSESIGKVSLRGTTPSAASSPAAEDRNEEVKKLTDLIFDHFTNDVADAAKSDKDPQSPEWEYYEPSRDIVVTAVRQALLSLLSNDSEVESVQAELKKTVYLPLISPVPFEDHYQDIKIEKKNNFISVSYTTWTMHTHGGCSGGAEHKREQFEVPFSDFAKQNCSSAEVKERMDSIVDLPEARKLDAPPTASSPVDSSAILIEAKLRSAKLRSAKLRSALMDKRVLWLSNYSFNVWFKEPWIAIKP